MVSKIIEIKKALSIDKAFLFVKRKND